MGITLQGLQAKNQFDCRLTKQDNDFHKSPPTVGNCMKKHDQAEICIKQKYQSDIKRWVCEKWQCVSVLPEVKLTAFLHFLCATLLKKNFFYCRGRLCGRETIGDKSPYSSMLYDAIT